MSPEQERTFIELSDKVHFPLSKTVFQAWCGAFTTTAIELVVFTLTGKVFLLPRPADDPWFAGQVHGPGTIVLPTDQTKEGVLQRLMRKEIGGGDLTQPQLIDWFIFPRGSGPHENPRGHEVGILFGSIHSGEVPSDVTLGDPEHLPDNIIVFHRDLIARAHRWFKTQ